MSDIEELFDFSDVENKFYWDASRTKLLIRTRLNAENHFRNNLKKKSVLWRMVLKKIKIKDPDFPFCVEECIKKYNNLFTTYKRIKARTANCSRSHWEYLHLFNEVFATTFSVNSPNNSTSVSEIQETNDNELSDSTKVVEDSTLSPRKGKIKFREFLDKLKREDKNNEDILNIEQNVEMDQSSPTEKKVKIGEFLARFESEDKKRHDELISIEKEKIKIEQEKLKMLREIKDILKNFQ